MISNKTILFLGSSVTYGSAANGISFADLLAQEYGCRAVKEAVSGTTLVNADADSYVSRLKKMDTDQEADLFICQLSTNDASQGKAMGQPDGRMDVSSVAGAIEFIVDYVRRTWRCPVAFYTNPRYDSAAYENMVALVKECSKKYGFEIINLWDDEAFNSLTAAQRERWLADPIHPTLEGYREWWLPVFARAVEEMCV